MQIEDNHVGIRQLFVLFQDGGHGIGLAVSRASHDAGMPLKEPLSFNHANTKWGQQIIIHVV